MSNVGVGLSSGSFSTSKFSLYELDEVPGTEVAYSGTPNGRTSFRWASYSYMVYGTSHEEKPLTVVNHMKESPYGSGLYFNAYARYTGTGAPTFEHKVKTSTYDGETHTYVTNTVTSGHFECFYPGTVGIISCYVGPVTVVYNINYSYPPTAGVTVHTIYRGNWLSASEVRGINDDLYHQIARGLQHGELESYLQKERLKAEAELSDRITRTITDGPYNTPIEVKFPVPRFNFKLNEYNHFECIRDLELIPDKLRFCAGNAYINACQNLPKTANNTLQNVVEVIDTIRSIKSGNLGKAAASFINSSAYEGAKSAWLMYRYQYNTTKMDFEEYKDLIFRLKDLQKLNKITIHGESAWGGYQCRCSFDVNACDFIPHTLNEFLRASGLYFKTADIWDDIPFSFIVDWFLHLGDVFTWLDTHEDAWNVRPSNVWYSWETSYDNQICYIRAPGEPIVNVPYLQQNSGSSAKVKAMRFADVISIFL
jgi:hypothetical protein